jgi:chitinase
MLIDNFRIPDPRTIFESASNGSLQVQNQLFAARWDIKYGFWGDSVDDAVQIYSIPTFMLRDGLKGLKNIKEVGEEVEAKERKALILNVITAVLMILPVAGPAAAEAAGFARAATTLAWLSFVGNEALGIYEIVSVSIISRHQDNIHLQRVSGSRNGSPSYHEYVDEWRPREK